jgi:polyisoprenoid-binding protein YceI
MALALAAPAALATDFRIDENRSYADFEVRLLWLHKVDGRFTHIAGEVRVSPQRLATVDVRIVLNSVVMDSSRFRRWVLAPEFFDAERYPVAHFLSDPVPLARLAAGGQLDGRLELRGVERPLRLQLLPTRCARLNASGCVIEARGAVSRSDFGMSSHRATLSDQVQLDLAITLDPTPE